MKQEIINPSIGQIYQREFEINIDSSNPLNIKRFPTPILVLYLDIRNINCDETDDFLNAHCQVLDLFKSHGWENLVIPFRGDTKLEVAAIEGSFNTVEFEIFKKQILEEINGSKSEDSK